LYFVILNNGMINSTLH